MFQNEIRAFIKGNKLSPTETLIIYALNTFTNKEQKCWPSIRALTEVTNLSVRAIESNLNKLIIKGLISKKTRVSKNGHCSSNIYQIDRLTPAGGAGYPPQEVRGYKNIPIRTNQLKAIVHPTDRRISFEQNITEVCEMKKKNPSERFDEFWEIYPRKEKKKEALHIWQRDNLDLKADEIIYATKDKISFHSQWHQGKKLIPLPTSYLNGERWTDEIIKKNEGLNGRIIEDEPKPGTAAYFFKLMRESTS